jgi:enoyl-CoA hydratase/3-hydroxyacyl-CoA dehydrogenase
LINSAPVNALSDAVLKGIHDQYQRAVKDESVKGIVITSAIPGFFVAGADLQEIAQKQKGDDRSVFEKQLRFVHALLKQIESGFKPTVAGIDGLALGGGLELAMSCNARVASSQSRVGLPELNLGIIPGYGGTQRLPRLVGVEKALEMMLTSAPIPATVAHQYGLVDRVVDSKSVHESSIDLAAQIATFKCKRTQALQLNTRIENAEKLQEIFSKQEANAKRTSAHLPHVFSCIAATKAGLEFNGDYGSETEIKESMKLMSSPVAAALIHLFFAEKATSKIPGLKPIDKKIKKLGIVGGGLMGSGIAIVSLQSGISVVLKEVNQQALDVGIQRVKSYFEDRLKKKRITDKQYNDVLSRFKSQITYDGFDELEMVIEAVVEIPSLKQQIFVDLERVCNKDCILATNTSTIDINIIGKNIKALDRLIGLHFFSPVPVMPLLEIIYASKTSQNTIAVSVNFGKQIRKTTVVVGNCPGFMVNRSFFPYSQCAAYLTDRGVHPYIIDKALQKFGFRVGPFLLADLVGMEVGSLVSKSYATSFPDRTYPTNLTDLLFKDKRLGSKTGLGFYNHDPKTGRPTPDPELEKYLDQAKKIAGNPKPLGNLTEQQIVEYLLFPAVNEACRIVEEGLTYRVSDIDIASVMGMMFPRHTGGLMKFGDSYGAKYICDRLDEMAKEANGHKIFVPCSYLRQHAQSGQSLYQTK